MRRIGSITSNASCAETEIIDQIQIYKMISAITKLRN